MKIKILFYINTIGRGGAERVMTNLANQCVAEGDEVVFVTSYMVENEYKLDYDMRRYNLGNGGDNQSFFKRNWTRISKLREICKREKPDILISFMAEPNIRAILATRGLKTKVIVSVRNDPNVVYGGKLSKIMGKMLMPLADGCVFQTQDAKEWFPKKLQRKSTIIVNAVKDEFYKVKRNPQKHVMVSCGRLEEQKNYPLLIDAFGEIVKKFPDAVLHIYGTGSLATYLNKKITESGLEDSVILKGQTDHVTEVLATADIFLMTSDYEGMPNSLLEASVVGVPCIATDCPCGGVRMIISNKENGLLVPVGDKTGLVNAITHLIDNEEEKKKFFYESKKRSEQYRSDIVLDEWINYIRNIVKE